MSKRRPSRADRTRKITKRSAGQPRLEALEPRFLLAQFTVTSTADGGPNTLRDAISQANMLSGPDDIVFNIGGTITPGPFTISLQSPLPPITEAVNIDGYTETGAQRNTMAVGSNAVLEIEITDGTTIGGIATGLNLSGSDNTISGLVLNGFDNQGILAFSSGNLITGNYIGTDVTGGMTSPNYDGIDVSGADNTIGGTDPGDRNLVSGNSLFGIGIISGSGVTGNLVLGNYVGTDATGTMGLGNLIGIADYGSGDTIGGAGTARNVVSGNSSSGINLSESGNLVQGNFVGVDATGTRALGNLGAGVQINASGSTVGGGDPAARNVISANSGAGINIGLSYSGNLVQGNYIGTDPTGTVDLGNQGSGIDVNADDNTIGGAVAGLGNLISGNAGSGIRIFPGFTDTGTIFASGNLVLGNSIGTDATGTVIIGNDADGVSITGIDNTIGGGATGARNLISGNGIYGVHVEGSGATGNLVSGNYVGTDISGAAALGNGNTGVYLNGPGNTVGGTATNDRNLISGNAGRGVEADQPNNLILGNYIGIDAAGTAAVPNLASGVFLGATGNTVGSLDPGGRNVVSGNNVQGGFAITASGNLVIGNYIGTDAAGTTAIPNEGGLVIVATGSTIGGTAAGARNIISGNNATGIYLQGSGNLIQGNFIGTDATGTAALGNSPAGISGTSAGSDNTIGGTATGAGNLISGNNGDGILLNATGVLVQGNRIGTDVAGVVALGNTSVGIDIYAGGNTIGGAATGAGNVISGNAFGGIGINVGASLVQGNRIGTGADGTAAIGNTARGIILYTAGNTIGGTDPGAGNLISGNDGVGIQIQGSGTLVQGNSIGTDATGNSAIGNTSDGILVVAEANTIGGASAGAGNVVSGNASFGIDLQSSGNLLLGNRIGTDAAGIVAVPNVQAGVFVNAADNTIGSFNPSSTNVISGNSGPGVWVQGAGATGVLVVGDFIGTDLNGTIALGNGAAGVFLDGAPGAAVRGNVISGNASEGILIGAGADNALILSNTIGLNLNGDTALGNTSDGISVAANDVTIGGSGDFPGSPPGNYISGNRSGIAITAGTGALVQGNLIGLASDGVTPVPNTADGIAMTGGSDATIGGIANVISGNAGVGIRLGGPRVLVQGNFIGTDIAGTAAAGNQSFGLVVGASGITVGGTASGAGNVISGNQDDGVRVLASGNLIVGNTIGADVGGTVDLGNAGSGLILNASGNTVGGTDPAARNLISGNDAFGIGVSGSGNLIVGNYIGTDVSGAADLGNSSVGLVLDDAGNTVGGTATGAGNLISGNDDDGVDILGSGNLILGNFIGTDASGTAALGNARSGLFVAGAVNTIGGTDPAARNLVSGNQADGISLTGSGNLVIGNDVGIDVTGTADLGNASSGIIAGASANTIGGTDPSSRNVVSGNDAFGIGVSGSANLVIGNYIGTDATGTADLGNTSFGLVLSGSANTVGGTATGAGNLISGNDAAGVGVIAPGNLVLGNFIGTGPSGTMALGNSGDGISVFSAANTVGGTDPAAGNLISGNGGAGISLSGMGASGNLVLGNLVGADLAGTAALANAGDGINVSGTANTIGGVGTGNLVSGNSGYGIVLGASSNLVVDNFVGTDNSGTAALANANGGLYVVSSGNTIGGVSGAGNLVSGNGNDQITLVGSGNLVLGNTVGLNVTGDAAIVDSGVGILVDGTANTIGGASVEGNVVSGNASSGISLSGSGNLVLGNRIGTDGAGTTSIANLVGIGVSAAGNTIGGANAGNLISGNLDSGIDLQAGSSGTVILGNFIGTDFAGGTALGNGLDGIRVTDAPDVTIGMIGAGNLISGNAQYGIEFFGTQTTGATVADNFIGTDDTGAQAIANGIDGVLLHGGVTGITVGGTAAGTSNVISGNAGVGVRVSDSGTSANLITGNRIGTDVTGSAALPNGGDGLLLTNSATSNTIVANLVSGNVRLGIDVDGASANLLIGNVVGLDLAGTAVLSNGIQGIGLSNAAADNTIGGTVPGAGNLVSGNGTVGVDLSGVGTTGNLVLGNIIGTDATGTVDLGNLQDGIAIGLGASNNTVGGAAGGRNLISGNDGFGVRIVDAGTSGNVVLGNFIGTDATGASGLGNGADGIVIQRAPDNTIGGVNDPGALTAGNLISANDFYGVEVTFAEATGNRILGNYIGTDAAGTVGLGNAIIGIRIESSGNTIGGAGAGSRNVVSGNAANGIQLEGSANLVVGNYVGTDAAGTVAVPNQGIGIFSLAPGNTIGGADPSVRNVVSGNASNGISVGSGALVLGNYVGLDAAGGVAIANGQDGIALSGSGNTIGGADPAARNVISGNGSIGLALAGSGASGNLIQGNYVGTDATGALAVANLSTGVLVGSDNNTIGGTDPNARNVVSGNAVHGIELDGSANLVLGNYVGTDAAGTIAVANQQIGIVSFAPGNTIGGADPAARNVVSGNSSNGIQIDSGDLVIGNYVGLNATGDAAIANGGAGVALSGSGNTVGGADPAARNVISGNSSIGLNLPNPTASGNMILGNYVGTDATGTLAVANLSTGVFIGAADNTIGGTGAGDGNLIAGNSTDGLALDGTGNLVQGNAIGVGATGAALGNGGNGVSVFLATNTIGGTATGAGNTIASNALNGVVTSVPGVTILSNAIFSNGLLGIDIGNDGVSPGGTPVIDLARPGPTTTLAGTLNNTPGTSFTIQFFANAAGDPSGYGEGEQFIGQTTVTTDSAGNASYSVDLPTPSLVGMTFTATATDTGGNTSEFSADFTPNPLVVTTTADSGFGSLRYAINYANGNPGVDTITFAIPGSGPFTIALAAALPDVTDPVFIDGYSQAGSSPNALTVGTNAVLMIQVAPGSGSTIADGLRLTAADNTITGLVLSGFSSSGIGIVGAGASGNLVAGNFIGTGFSGTTAFGNGDGITISDATGNTIGGLLPGDRNLISGNAQGIEVFGSVPAGNEIVGNLIGTDATGTAALGNTNGIILSSPGNFVGGSAAGAGNVISGNTNNGVLVQGSVAGGNLIRGNLIGTDAAGTAILANAGDGILLRDAPGNTIGGTAGGARNVLSGNDGNGIDISGTGASGNLVLGNYVGLDVTGTRALGNAGEGVFVGGPNNTIGGTDPGSRNVIAGNLGTTAPYDGDGIRIIGTAAEASGNLILGNYIGTDAGGTVALGNTNDGIEIQAPLNTVGGTAPGAGNLIAGNLHRGITIITSQVPDASRNLVLGNTIGLDATGLVALPNRAGGIDVASASNTIGGTDPGARNLISGNGGDGVLIRDSSNLLIGNFIGTDQIGSTPIGNAGRGVNLTGSATGNTIGGVNASPGFLDAGNLISGNAMEGVLLSGSGASGNVVLGNFIGTDGSGLEGLGTQTVGVAIRSGAFANTIGGANTAPGQLDTGNLISGSLADGVLIAAGSAGNLVRGNFIGTNNTGDSAISNGGYGINVQAVNATIGGVNASANGLTAGNLVAGNADGGILIAADGALVRGNFVGTDASGGQSIGNRSSGITLIDASGATIGGGATGAGNLVSGNLGDGLRLVNTLGGPSSSGLIVQGNRIGTDASGQSEVGNDGSGILLDGLSNALIGGSGAGQGNLISGNGDFGIRLTGAATGDRVVGNLIGVDAGVSSAIGNLGGGIDVASPSNTIGGTTAAEANVIAGNGGAPFDTRTNLTAAGVVATATGDVNGDSLPDLVYLTSTAVIAYRNLGDGTFDMQNPITLYSGSGSFNALAVDEAGTIAVGDASRDRVLVLRPDAQGTYQATIVPIGGTPVDLAFGQINGDGFLDLIVAESHSSGGGTVSIYPANAAGGFGQPITVTDSTTSTPTAVAFGVLRTDPTIAATTRGIAVALASSNPSVPGAVLIVEVAPDGTLGMSTSFPVGGQEATDVAIGDFNLDGRGDLAVAASDGTVSVFIQDLAGGTFAVGPVFAVGPDPVSLVAADFEGTFSAELAVLDRTDNTVTLITEPTTSGSATMTFAVGDGTTGVGAAALRMVPGAAASLVAATGSAGALTVFTSTAIRPGGIRIAGSGASGNRVLGNAIGTDRAGTLALGNRGPGVLVRTAGNTVGGTASGAGNTIAFNDGSGVVVDGATGVPILGNGIFLDGTPGILLTNGGNALRPAPTLTRAVVAGNRTIVDGTVTGTPGATVRVEVFASPENQTVPPEAAQFLGSVDVTIGQGGQSSFTFTLGRALPFERFITATATGLAGMNTSAISDALSLRIATINSDGPLTAITVGGDGTFQAIVPPFTGGQVFPPDSAPGDAGIFVRSADGTVNGLDAGIHPSSAAGSANSVGFHTTSFAKSADGLSVTSVMTNAIGDSPVAGPYTVTQVTSYNPGQQVFRVANALTNTGNAPITIDFFAAADLYLADSDLGVGFFNPASFAVGGSDATGTFNIFVQPDPQSPGLMPTNYQEGDYNAIWSTIGSGSDFNNTVRAPQGSPPYTNDPNFIDNGAGLQWAGITVAPGQSVQFNYVWGFGQITTIGNQLVVTNTFDAGPGSLRQAIIDSNTLDGRQSISFAIPGTGTQTIDLATPLPAVTDPVTIDATTQPGYDGTVGKPVVELVGAGLGQGADGIDLEAPDVQLRGLAIGSFTDAGLVLGSTGALVSGNFIGTDATGTVSRGNGTGVRVLGGANVLSGNLISGNLGGGVVITGGDGNQIAANRIGVGSAGGPLGNGGAGITILNASDTAIGGNDPAALGNTIAHNGGAGVRIPTTSSGQVALGNAILGNSITANGGLGIDLGPAGVTPNDPVDTDTGPNGLQNAPVLQVLTVVNSDLLVTGTLQSTPNTGFRLEFFNDPGDPSGYGEGETLLALHNVTTDATGRASYSFTLPGAATLAGVITATATDPQGNTSEFSNGLTITNQPQFVVVNTNDAGPGSLRQTILDANATPGEQQIRFAIPGDGPFVINLASPLPAISEAVTINAGTQFGYNGAPIVAIAGMNAGPDASGLTISAPNVTIVDLAIAGFSDSGVDLFGGSARLVGNIIGTGFGELPGNADFGVLVDSSSNVVGGPTTGDTNSIAGNGADGVHVASGQFNAILTNSITDNGGLGIRLAALAGAPAPNNGIVAPSLLSAGKIAGGLTRVSGVVVGAPGTTRLVQLFADPGDPSGNGEGAFYLGTVAVVIAPVGFGAFTFDSPMPVADGLLITATATDADGNTSEFSNAAPQQPTPLDPFTVVNTNDSGPGSLRQVILNANAVPGVQTISFAIPAAPDHAIHLASALPAITDPVQLDARTQSGPPVELDGSMAGPTADGIVVQSGNSLIAGLVIENFAGNGILLVGAGGNQLVGNIIGVDPTTMIDRANGGDGVAVRDSADNTIALNIISDNGGSGISLLGAGTTGNLVQGNLIGTNANGLVAMGNGNDGVLIAEGARDNTIGGESPEAGNLIAGNAVAGVAVIGTPPSPGAAQVATAQAAALPAGNNRITGNFIGALRGGVGYLANGTAGVLLLETAGNTVGGIGDAAANIIAGGNQAGVWIVGAGSTENLVTRNGIGTTLDGSAYLNGLGSGVLIQYGAHGNSVGGPVPGMANIISGQATAGVRLADGASENFVGFNRIGQFRDTAAGNMIGILVDSTSGNTLRSNVIAGNGLGIRLAPGSSDNLLVGNVVGLNPTFDAALPNSSGGILLQGAVGNTIGGTGEFDRNFLSGNLDNPFAPGDDPAESAGLTLAAGSTGNLVISNYVGLDPSGTLTIGNAQNGITVNQSSGNTIGGDDPSMANVIAGNGNVGLILTNGASGNLVVGNRIGTDPTGQRAMGNATDGVYVEESPGNTIGGTAAGAGNLVAGNAIVNVQLTGAGASGNLVLGNRIGTNADGTAAMGVASTGIFLEGAPDNTIGGTADGAGNLVSGHTAGGVHLVGPGASGNLIAGNRIGTDADGLGALPNQQGLVLDQAPSNTIGGLTAGARNLISGNALGVQVHGAGASGNVLLGNEVGVDATGVVALANQSGGIFVNDAPANTIGGTTPESGNVISGNGGIGLQLFNTGSAGNLVASNRVGVNRSATVAVPNKDSGIYANNAPNNTIGGPGGNIVSANTNSGIVIFGDNARGNAISNNVVGTPTPGQSSATFGNDVGIFVTGVTNVMLTEPMLMTTNTVRGNRSANILVAGNGGPVVIGTPEVVRGAANAITQIRVTFSSPLDRASAERTTNYRVNLTAAGTGPADPISRADYFAADNSVLLTLSQPLPASTDFLFTVIATPPLGVRSTTGLALDGNADNVPGDNYQISFRNGAFLTTGQATAAQSASVSAGAVDSILGNGGSIRVRLRRS